MKILVDRLSTTPEHYAFQVDGAWWRQRVPSGGFPGELVDVFAVEVDVHLMGEDIFFSGNLGAALEVECGRCLTRYRHALQEDFQLVAEPAGTRVPADPEVCLEVISLALPVQPLCREECPGLCSRCGAELAEGPCGCDEARPNSPFAVLAALRDETEGVS
jgi:uncharacterized metal-binding protein YceD (DUF177 family)